MWSAVKISNGVLLKHFGGIVIMWLVIQTNSTKNIQDVHVHNVLLSSSVHRDIQHSTQDTTCYHSCVVMCDGLLGTVIRLLLKGRWGGRATLWWW